MDMEITTTPEAPMTTWTLTTQAEGRIRSRSTMTHTITAATKDDACYEARQAHIWKGRISMDRSIFIIDIKEA
jgi:hypothetical protein